MLCFVAPHSSPFEQGVERNFSRATAIGYLECSLTTRPDVDAVGLC